MHKPYRQYLEDTTPFERTFDLLWYLLYRAKESYSATPPDQQAELWGKMTSSKNAKSLDQLIEESKELQRQKYAEAAAQNGTAAHVG